MDIVNETSFPHGFVIGKGPKGQPILTIIVKGTFTIPGQIRAQATPADSQLPLATTDEYYNEDATGSARIESDKVPYKPRADIVLVGNAYAPGKQPATIIDVLLRVGRVFKIIRVFGDRHWRYPSWLSLSPSISQTQPFTEMPLIYERAFGGIDHKAGKWCKENLIGCGFIGKKSKDSVHKKTLPNLENPKNLIKSWDNQPKPVGFGFYGRNWQPRIGYAGTYDDKWQAERAPEMAEDFRFDFYNGAHPDLQVLGYLHGDEEVEMRHLTPKGHLLFQLPGVKPAITITKYMNPSAAKEQLLVVSTSGEVLNTPLIEELPTKEEKIEASLDTLVFLPDAGIFYQVWRGLCPLRDLNVEEISTINIQTQNI